MTAVTVDPPSGALTAPRLTPGFRYDMCADVRPRFAGTPAGTIAIAATDKLIPYLHATDDEPHRVHVLVEVTDSYLRAVLDPADVCVLYLDTHARLLAEDVAGETRRTGLYTAQARHTRLRIDLWRRHDCPAVVVRVHELALRDRAACERVGRAIARGILRYAHGVAREASGFAPTEWAWAWPGELAP